jgi:sec-independent protein translocase protein TatB
MFGLSFFEIIFLAVLALVVIGPKQLPEVARTLGKFLRDFKRTTNVMTDDLRQSMREEKKQEVEKPPTAPKGPNSNV